MQRSRRTNPYPFTWEIPLFLFTAVAGRLWCGFSCPQTVYTEIFMWIEHKIEGDRSARIRLGGEHRVVGHAGQEAHPLQRPIVGRADIF